MKTHRLTVDVERQNNVEEGVASVSLEVDVKVDQGMDVKVDG